WGTAFKLIVFMPMAISFLAAGIIFRVVYDQDPDRGLANAVVTSVHDIFNESSQFPGARPRDAEALPARPEGGFVTADPVSLDGSAGQTLLLPLVGVEAESLPEEPTVPVEAAPGAADTITGTVWFDFTRGG